MRSKQESCGDHVLYAFFCLFGLNVRISNLQINDIRNFPGQNWTSAKMCLYLIWSRRKCKVLSTTTAVLWLLYSTCGILSNTQCTFVPALIQMHRALPVTVSRFPFRIPILQMSRANSAFSCRDQKYRYPFSVVSSWGLFTCTHTDKDSACTHTIANINTGTTAQTLLVLDFTLGLFLFHSCLAKTMRFFSLAYPLESLKLRLK